MAEAQDSASAVLVICNGGFEGIHQRLMDQLAEKELARR